MPIILAVLICIGVLISLVVYNIRRHYKKSKVIGNIMNMQDEGDQSPEYGDFYLHTTRIPITEFHESLSESASLSLISI